MAAACSRTQPARDKALLLGVDAEDDADCVDGAVAEGAFGVCVRLVVPYAPTRHAQ